MSSPSEPGRQLALEELCQAYWRPLYAFARRNGHPPPDAEDLVQGFFALLLSRGEQLASLTPAKGRLRMFFKTAFGNFITDSVRHKSRLKRGGPGAFRLDLESAERQLQEQLPDTVTPEAEFDRQWAHSILRRALAQLREKFRARGRSETWHELEVFLGPDESAPAYALVAAKLGQTENTVAAAVRRMREEFHELLRAEVANVLADGEDVDEELRYLLSVAG